MPYADPERQRAYKAQWSRNKRGLDTRPPAHTAVPLPTRVAAAEGVLALLVQAANDVRQDTTSGACEKGRVLASLAGAMLRALDVVQAAGHAPATEFVVPSPTRTPLLDSLSVDDLCAMLVSTEEAES